MSLITAPNWFAQDDSQSVDNGIVFSLADKSRLKQVREREIRRYGAYFSGWCQGFGEHGNIHYQDGDTCWVISETQVGMVLSRPQMKILNHEVLLHEQLPPLEFCRQGAQVGTLIFPFKGDCENQVLYAIEQLMETGPDLHVFLASHFFYGIEGRVITLSSIKPLPLIYRGIGTMQMRLMHSNQFSLDLNAFT